MDRGSRAGGADRSMRGLCRESRGDRYLDQMYLGLMKPVKLPIHATLFITVLIVRMHRL